MTPFFDPGPNPHGSRRAIFLAGVGPQMTEVAGEVADGFFVHPFNTPESVRDVTLPALERGLARAGRRRDGFQISLQLMIVIGRQRRRSSSGRATPCARRSPSTARRRPIGWCSNRAAGGLQPELNRLSKRGRWNEMAALVSDELLDAVAVCAPPGGLAAKLRERTQGVADRVSLVAPWAPDPARLERDRALAARSLMGA